MRANLFFGITMFLMLGAGANAAPIKIGANARLGDSPRSDYNRTVNWRPADGEVVTLNPPRMSWPYWKGWPHELEPENHVFRFQISPKPDCTEPVVDVETPVNFYNMIPELKGAKEWFWRVGWDIGTPEEKWSPVRSFRLAEDAVVWDRALLADPPLARIGHPRVLFTAETLPAIRELAKSDAGSAAAFDYMRRKAEATLGKAWWKNFPKSDKETEPEQEFYTIAEELVNVCFLWKLTGDERYAGVKERALTLASYPPGGRSSPQTLGGDGAEDATQSNEFVALLFDWLYQELTDAEREVMIKSLNWRVEQIMNDWSWRRRRDGGEPIVSPSGLSGQASSHPYESSMANAVTGVVLYEHSEVGRLWYHVITNFMIGVSSGHGFDEAWNEGPGYGPSKFKWFVNSSLYLDTAIPGTNLGRNPFYARMCEFFSRIIPVGMPHNSWGNQASASRGNHLATFRKLAYMTGNGTLLYNWQQYGGEEFSSFRPWIEYVLPYYYKAPEPAPERDTVGLFAIDGWATAATGPPSDARTFAEGLGLGFQSRPRGAFGHSFNSDNSVIMHAYGQMLNHGGGSSANGDAFAYHTMSHNTLLVNGLGQAQPSPPRQTVPAYGRIVGHARGDGTGDAVPYVYFAGDATHCYPSVPGKYSRWSLPLHKVYEERALPDLQRFVRHVLFVRGEYFIIYDDVASAAPATYTWLYHILPDTPIVIDPATKAIDYSVGEVKVRLQQIAHPDQLEIENRKGLAGYTNPVTGEDYTKQRKDEILCGHNLWISNKRPVEGDWNFLAVVYPAKPGQTPPPIERIDDKSVRVGEDVITFAPDGPAAERADIIVDPVAMRSAPRATSAKGVQ